MIEPITVRLKSPHGLSVLEGDQITLNWHWTARPDGPALQFIKTLKWYEPLRIWFAVVTTDDPTERFVVSVDPRQHKVPPPPPPMPLVRNFEVEGGEWRFVDVPACAVFGKTDEIEQPVFEAHRFETHHLTRSFLAAICTGARTLGISDSDILMRFRGNRNLRGWILLRDLPNRYMKTPGKFEVDSRNNHAAWERVWGIKSMIL